MSPSGPGPGPRLRLGDPVSALPGIGPRRAAALAAGGIHTLVDLLWQLPRGYQDRRRIQAIADLEDGDVTVCGVLRRLELRRTRRKLSLLEGRLEDVSGGVEVVWFNQPFLRDRLVIGQRYLLSGRFKKGRWGGQLVGPEIGDPSAAAGGIVPVYSSIGAFSPRQVRGWVSAAMERLDLERELPEHLPSELLARRGLPSRAAALRQLHAPPADGDLEAFTTWTSGAHSRLIYGELLEQQLRLAFSQARLQERHKEHRYAIDDDLRTVVSELLPFRLTAAQRRAIGEIVRDLQAPPPMRRLLQGDVGSGKTIVAACALTAALASGLQAAYMAPTELLAEQQWESLRTLLDGRYRVELISGSRRSGDTLAALARGDAILAVGTHALLEEGVRLPRLALVIVDEQHRFGVAQRAALEAKGRNPDVLVMSATPIPRSLALSAYGDLAVSVLEELPPGRRQAVTEVCRPGQREEVYRRVGERLEQGQQAYVVFPRIEPRDDDVPALDGLGARLEDLFAVHGAVRVHGQLPPEERRQRMADFVAGTSRLLLATTIIEVGVDVPRAAAMVIEGAERFGLAQLHQLRGRVGRGEVPGWCAAIATTDTPEAAARLAAFARCRDGFALAEEDLQLRGPGEILGVRQTGAPGYRIADLRRDADWLDQAHQDARELVGRLDRAERARLARRFTRRARG